MKKIGIIGGIEPESTIDTYKRMIGAFQARPFPICFEIHFKDASSTSSDTSGLIR
jgi:hypothetical protein